MQQAAAHRTSRWSRAKPLIVMLAASALLLGQVPRRRARGCPAGTVSVLGQYCIDRYEGALVEILPNGRTRPWTPFQSPPRGGSYRAVSRLGLVPQGYVSQLQARAACTHAGKRLCTETEWSTACRGPTPTTYPYGDDHINGRCNDAHDNPVPRIFPGNPDVFHFTEMNDPRLNQLPDSVARTGQFTRCSNRFGVRDMVGNLHEWIERHQGNLGVFRGGFYADSRINGAGCNYTTIAHSPSYHDYSTGFRCCADLR